MDGGWKEAGATEVWLYFAIMFHEKQFEDYCIFSVIRRSIFSKKFCLINLDLFQNWGESYNQVFSWNKMQESSLCWKKGDITVIRNFENAASEDGDKSTKLGLRLMTKYLCEIFSLLT